MTFNHKTVNLPELTTETINRKRFYVTPEGNKYPSITTVLSNRKKEGLWEWRKRVGNDVANYVARTAAARGTKVHHMCEDYLNNVHVDWPEKWKEHERQFLAHCLFNQLKEKALCNINNIYALEKSLYSNELGVAGTVDCIAEYNGELSIIDFKTAAKPKPRDWIENYFVQAAAYACMFYELTDIPVKKLVILMTCENGEVTVYEEYDKMKYMKLLVKYIEKFVEDKLNGNQK